jgi:hypothetical protein
MMLKRFFCKTKKELKKMQQILMNTAIEPYCIGEGTDLGLFLCFASPQKSDFFAISLKKLYVFCYNTILKNYKEVQID